MSYFGDAPNNDPFGTNGMVSVNSFLPPDEPKRSNKALIIALVSLGSILVLGAIAGGVVYAVSHFGPGFGSGPSAGQKGGPSQDLTGQDSSAGVTPRDYSLDSLNAFGAASWSEDTFGYIGSNRPLVVYLSDYASDDLNCGLWMYGSESEALAAYGGSDFSRMQGQVTWGASGDGSVGYVLIADSNSSECAIQAFDFLGVY